MDHATIIAVCPDGTTRSYFSPSRISSFDALDLATCAARRAALYAHDGARFSREYETLRLWVGVAHRMMP